MLYSAEGGGAGGSAGDRADGEGGSNGGDDEHGVVIEWGEDAIVDYLANDPDRKYLLFLILVGGCNKVYIN